MSAEAASKCGAASNGHRFRRFLSMGFRGTHDWNRRERWEKRDSVMLAKHNTFLSTSGAEAWRHE
jgi:hypothetical protein